MRLHPILIFFSGLFLLLSGLTTKRESRAASNALPVPSLCEKAEKVVFSCQLKNSAKIVSLCSSSKLSKTEGYLQYRFGVSGKIELEYPKQRSDAQKSFHYSHYFRARFDLTEISFSLEGHTYTVFDNYNGEEKRSITDQGITVKLPGDKKEVSYACRGEAKADYGDISEAFENEYEP
jgi:hypothetical protein